MKKAFFTILAVIAVIAARAQSTPSASTTLDAQRIIQLRENERLLLLSPEKPNEIRFGRTSCDGIFVQFGKGANPLQMVNPVASQFGSPVDNVVQYRTYNMPLGLKFFSFNF
jgi:hypothetical protein